MNKPANSTQTAATSKHARLSETPRPTSVLHKGVVQRFVQQQRRMLIHLSNHPAVIVGNLPLALRAISLAAAEALNVCYCSVWRLTLDGEVCHELIRIKDGAEIHDNHILTMHDYPGYFAAVRSGWALGVVNVSQDPRTKALTQSYWLPHNISSSIQSPIRLHGQVAGLVCFEHSGPVREWQADELTFAGQIATLIGQVFLNADLQRRAEELDIITNISRAISAAHKLGDILHSIARHAAEFSGADISGIFAFKANGEIITAGYGVTEDFIQFIRRKMRVLIKEGVLAEAIAAQRPKQISDLGRHQDKLSRYIVAEQNTRALLIVPLFNDERFTGVIFLGQSYPHTFTREDIIFSQSLGQQALNALENARLFQAERRQREMAERLHQIALWVNSSLNLNEVLERILKQLKYVCPYESGSVQTLENDTMRIVATHNMPTHTLGRVFSLSGHRYNQQLASGKTVIIHDSLQDAQNWIQYDDLPFMRSNLGVPLWVRERVIGALTIDSRVPHTYTAEDLRVVQVFAQQAAVAIQNTQLFERQQVEQELAHALADAASVISSTLDQDQVLDYILEQVDRVIDGDIFNIMMIENGLGKVVRGRGYENYGIAYNDIAQFETPILEYPKLVQMIATGKPVQVNDILADPDWVVSNPYRRYLRSYVAAPIRIATETVGFLNVNGTRAYQFTPRDVQRLKAFADHAAVAIQNAQIYQKQLHLADTLERKVHQRTAELEAKNAWLQAIQDSTTDGIIVTDSDGTIVERNQVMKDWQAHMFSPTDAECFLTTVRDMAHQASEQPDTVLELSQLDLQLTAAPISGKEANVPGVVIAVHDVSFLKTLDRMKSRFVSDVSHELRTPLTAFGLYIQLLRNRPVAQHGPYLDALEQENQRLTTLVEDILHISRIESGKMSLDKASVDLNVLTATTVANHLILAESHQQELTYTTTDMDAHLDIDEDKFSQVINNLVRNAINYTPEGGHIHITVAHQMRNTCSWLTISVQDTGMGIPKDEVQYIFDRFFRGDGPRKMQIQGTGLGLAIVKEVVELHGGEVIVESQIGVGSTFTVWLPMPPLSKLK